MQCVTSNANGCRCLQVTLLQKLDHPYCHYLVGAKIEVDANGGPLLLTEICEEGSLFDLYAKKQMKFDPPTSWRIAKECALGLEHIHNLGFMHRDLKSLNVFMARGFSARVADFGMALEEEVLSSLPPCLPSSLPTSRPPAPFSHPSPCSQCCSVHAHAMLLLAASASQLALSHSVTQTNKQTHSLSILPRLHPPSPFRISLALSRRRRV